ncbi:MAG: ABC transporter permease [Bacteroidota bacterium]
MPCRLHIVFFITFASTGNMQTTVIDAKKKRVFFDLKELYRYRDLLFILTYRDIRVRYAQTFLGLAWAVLQPLCILLILTFIFGNIIPVDTLNIPYPLFAISGMAGWTYFSFVMSQAGDSIISHQSMIQKIYFPRILIPFSKAMTGLIDFAISLLFVLVLLIYYRHSPGASLLYLPVFVLLTLITSLAAGIWISALTVRFRDFKHIVPFIVQLGLYATPVGYPSSLVPEKYQMIYFLNPMAGIVEGFRWCLLNTAAPPQHIWISFAVVFLLFISGLFYFKKMEYIMADIV